MPRNPAIFPSGLRRPQNYVCWRCQQSRSISTTFLQKQSEAKEQWKQWAMEIRAGKRKSVLQVLEERGYVKAIAGERNALDNLMIDKRIGAYCGVDPTASSLHVGHLLPLMTLFWMHLHGCHTITLIGGATSKIGDPTGRSTSRAEMTATERKANMITMQFQMKKIWANVEKIGAKHGYAYEKYWKRGIVNNATWWGKYTFTEILKSLGNGMRMGTMLSRDTAKTKLASAEGMSYAEFSYPILQAWDWWHMYQALDIQIQVGGADQYGNIISGVDAVKYLKRTHTDPVVRQDGILPLNTPYGFTVPLLTTSTGEKFGKSAGNAIWLDQSMTSSFSLYGFFVRTADTDVERFLKFFTFLSLPKIQSIMDKHKTDPSQRIAQHTLASEFLELVHGPEEAKNAESEHRALYAKPTVSSILGTAQNPQHPVAKKPNPMATHQDPKTREASEFWASRLNKHAVATDQNNAPMAHVVLPKSLVYGQPIARVLYSAGLVFSRSEGHRLAQQQGAYIGARSSGKQTMGDDVSFIPAKLMDPMQTWKHVIRDEEKTATMEKEGEEGLLILRQGKWRVRICRLVSDEKFESMGLEDPPGWLEFKTMQKVGDIREMQDLDEFETAASPKVSSAKAREMRGKNYRANVGVRSDYAVGTTDDMAEVADERPSIPQRTSRGQPQVGQMRSFDDGHGNNEKVKGQANW